MRVRLTIMAWPLLFAAILTSSSTRALLSPLGAGSNWQQQHKAEGKSSRALYSQPNESGDLGMHAEFSKLQEWKNNLWWELFQQDAVISNAVSNAAAASVAASAAAGSQDRRSRAPGLAHPSWIPDLGAWRAAVPEIGNGVAGRGGKRSSIMSQHQSGKFSSSSSSSLSSSSSSQQSPPPPSLKSYLNGTALLLEPHVSRIMGNFDAIINKNGSTKEFKAEDLSRVQEAVRIAYLQLWGKVTMRSLEDCIKRNRGVATILSELHADAEVVIAGILQEPFDQIKDDEDADYIRGELVRRFGPAAVDIAERYHALPKFMARKASYTPEQSENHIQMLVAFLQDYRTLYIRLADRLHTMRTLRTLPLDHSDRRKIAQEALSVYAPLAHKMGIMKVKGELEDLAFRFLNPEKVKETRNAQVAANKAYHQAANQIQEIIEKDQFLIKQRATYHLTYRIKDQYQLNLKMKRKELKNVSEVRDALGLRIIVDCNQTLSSSETTEQYLKKCEEICYHFVDKLRNLKGWEPCEDGFKDYIKNTKENGYQSLHQYIKNTALGTNVEVQVRTREMHLQAELGEAAHWFYKDNLYRCDVANSKSYNVAWRSKEQMNEAKSSAQMIGMAQKQILAARVFIFLNDRATVLNLKRGATALDAAFAIHTEVGLTTRSVTVDGKPSQLNRPLQNGETISVEIDPIAVDVPKDEWLDYVNTSFARQSLRQHFKERHRSGNILLGIPQLLMSLNLNAAVIEDACGGVMPDAWKIEALAMERLEPCAGIADFLECLAGANSTTLQATLAALFDVPPALIATTSKSSALLWARMQGRNGWEDKTRLRATVLNPIIKDMLPSLYEKRYMTLEKRWMQLICSTDEVSGLVKAKKLRQSLSGGKMKIKRMPPSLPVASRRATLPKRSSTFSPVNVFLRVAKRPYCLEAASVAPLALRIAKFEYGLGQLRKQESTKQFAESLGVY